MRAVFRIFTMAMIVGATGAARAGDANFDTMLPAFEEAFRQTQCQAVTEHFSETYSSVENVLKVRFTDLGSRSGAKRIRRKMKALPPTELDKHVWPLLQIGQYYVCIDAEKLALQHYDTFMDTLEALPEKQNDLIRGPLHLWAGQAAYLRSKEKQATMFLSKALESCRLVKAPDSAVICEASAAVQLAQLQIANEKYTEAHTSLAHTAALKPEQGPLQSALAKMAHALSVLAYEMQGNTEASTTRLKALASLVPALEKAEYLPVYKAMPMRQREPWSALGENRDMFTFEFTIDANGYVKNIQTVSSDGHKKLEQQAIEALGQFRYTPQMQGGVFTETKGITYTFTFEDFYGPDKSNRFDAKSMERIQARSYCVAC